ncbi:outer membrane protein assembly factor BamA [Geobacter sp. OR-1]|uniref:outer membrane protein assembly factor BamA n=1 Tax=Geobacter sp. OR-1 TaxID=1266765 RepID=UPI0005423542|nr:outer membrane protein assembly factor BamA [Geobacter sp. OR-1]GAM07943.1 outer membrane protein assembly factor BamA [Geobacter sp. OR-1]
MVIWFGKICALILLLITVAAGYAGAEGERIAEVRVSGNRRIESDAIRNALMIKAGDLLYLDKVDADVRAVYKLGHFQDVKAETTPGDKGLILTYTVSERPVVRDVKIEGNKELSAEKIKEALEVKPNSIYSAKDLARSIRKIKKLYADEGYYLAEVESATEKRGDTDLKVVLKITEGKKILIQELLFTGNKSFTRRKLKGLMETTEDWWLSWLTGAGVYKEEVLKNDMALIADFYFNNGYVNVKVAEPRVELLPDKRGLQVQIDIREGDQYRAGSIDFKGDLLEKSEELSKKLKLKSGEIFSRAILRNDVFILTDVYADQGYAFANVNPVTRVNPEAKTVDITFDMEKGDKVYIDRITIAGNPKTRDKVVRRELKLAEGDLYSGTGLKKSKQNLMNLGFFEEVTIATERGSADNRLNLKVDVKEKPTGTFSIGAGYSSLDGFIGQGSVQQSNFFGLGLKANASASIGGKSSTYSFGLTDPYFLDSKWTVGADLYRSQRDYIDYTRRAIGGDLKAGYLISDTLSTFWIYKYEQKEIFNLSQAFILSKQEFEPTSTTSSITASVTSNNTDYRMDPTTGTMSTLSAEFAGLGGTSRYARYIGEATYFTPLVWNSVFSVRGVLGHIQGLGKDIPIDEKFYLGGINTLRGFGGRTVSPYKIVDSRSDVNATNAVIRSYTGGTTEAIFTAEITMPLLKEAGLKGVLFFDTGNSYDKPSQMFSVMRSSYGFGVRWFSPIGPLRLEYGIPLNPREGIDSRSGKIEFSIGSFF